VSRVKSRGKCFVLGLSILARDNNFLGRHSTFVTLVGGDPEFPCSNLKFPVWLAKFPARRDKIPCSVA
jgi:hypothetical protein